MGLLAMVGVGQHGDVYAGSSPQALPGTRLPQWPGQSRPAAGSTPGVGSRCLLLPAPLPRWHRQRGKVWGGDAQPHQQLSHLPWGGVCFCSPLAPLSPPCLCAQVYRAKAEGDTGALAPRMKSGTPSSSQLNLSMLGRSPSPKVWLPGGARRHTAPDNLAVAPEHPVPAPVPVPAADCLPSCPGPPEPSGQPAPQPGSHAAGH